MPPRRTFGHSWWGQAWTRALETRARLDPNRLPRGRTYARHDRVRGLAVHPGEITAFVQGSRLAPYRVAIGIRRFTDDEWQAAVGAIARRAAHAAALLDGEIDPDVVADCAAAGAELLPGPGELRPRCSCPDWADPCKHAAAVTYLVADVLDADPFALFLLRGRDRDALMAAVRAERRGTGTAADADADADPAVWPDDPGEVARQVWARARDRAAAHRPAAPIPTHPSPPAPWPTDPPPGAPFTAAGLDVLAADAAHRAFLQLRGEGSSGLGLAPADDLARRAAELLGDVPRVAALARAARVRTADLARWAQAWEHGGAAALAVLDQRPWRPPVATMAEARRRVVEVVGPRVVVADDRITIGSRQLRLGHDGRWWRLEKDRGRWAITSDAAESPDDLLV